jgi:DNA-binding MarR family transcriptional regulator
METAENAAWRLTHLGQLLGHAMRKFDARVLALMAADADVPLGLSNLARRNQVSAAHIHITRHLPVKGARLSDLALRAGMSKQAMAKLVVQCESWGIVTKQSDVRDARASLLLFTPSGLDWLDAFQRATAQAQAEFQSDVGDAVATVVILGLEAYASAYDPPKPGKRNATAMARNQSRFD